MKRPAPKIHAVSGYTRSETKERREYRERVWNVVEKMRRENRQTEAALRYVEWNCRLIAKRNAEAEMAR